MKNASPFHHLNQDYLDAAGRFGAAPFEFSDRKVTAMRTLSVVIADDERVIIDGFLKLIHWEKIGCRVDDVAFDGIMAVEKTTRIKPDIAIIDINMPLLSGLDVIRQASPDSPDTVFIIISGYDEFSYAREALKLRAYDYLLKPVDFAQFEALIERLRRERFDLPVHERPQEAREKDAEPPTIQRIVSYIDQHCAEDLTLKKLAEVFYMNPAYLSQYFKAKTGMNYFAYLSRLRSERAKHLLITTDMTIGDIARTVGGADYRTFTKRFRRTEGVSPSAFRKKNGQL
jgi:two-component system response regulator YesN